MSPSPNSTNTLRLHVAIIGGGITGLTLALGLQTRNVSFTIYERASSFKEIGAGIGFSPNAERALKVIDPRVHDAYKRVATPNGEDFFQWVDGRHTDEIIYKLYLGQQGFQGCRRSDFVDELATMIPGENVRFDKQIEGIVEEENGGRVRMRFKDGSVEEADVVIGCDGIRSRTRHVLFGPSHAPSYTHKFCFRALIPLPSALPKLGVHRTSTRFMYNGPEAHIITYPVAMGEILNVLLVISDSNPWTTEDGRHTSSGSKQEALAAFANWHPTARTIVDLLPEQLDKWAIFDMHDRPAPYYARGSVGIAGDAAHAAGPHLGAGAGFGMEDALVLAALLEAADKRCEGGKSKGELCCGALETYNEVRYERTQWLVGLTREACDLFQWQNESAGSDSRKFAEEITWRFQKIWEYDIDGMVRGALEGFGTKSGWPEKGQEI
ncbi:uncharacterized protein BCR38DRAFT_410903 [Pseudomassariella vexata]|uniref:FAD-binding domain-containing protein n=1 Tax=Pseudomassariella vexata TaxID=1141098 RepID=A0A1Y2DTK3_9PEZI|nr:uncharacterized protein BCR38DRAFT_410903 [Pseudomassariella vexata]ORY62499.1 hypothetical protein BCR38DRAFT_410903 [Pseudomassariella vexata]